MLKLENINKDYISGDTTVHALKNINIEFRESEFVSILGQSGGGKTTLLNIIGGLDRYTSGDLIINNKSTKNFKDRDWDAYRNYSVGFVFQNYSLMPVLNVYDNVALPVTFDRGHHVDHDYIKARLVDLGLWEKRTRFPRELSGGQQQRVAIARALANKPSVILADEPTGNLDSATSIEVMGLLRENSRKYHQTILMVTHNEALAQYCDRIIRIEDGRIAHLSKGDKGGE